MDYEHRKLTQYPYPIGVLARMYPDMDVLSLVETSLRHETILDMALKNLGEQEQKLAFLKFHTVKPNSIIADELGYRDKHVVERETRSLIKSWKDAYEKYLREHPEEAEAKGELTGADITAWYSRRYAEMSS